MLSGHLGSHNSFFVTIALGPVSKSSLIHIRHEAMVAMAKKVVASFS